MGLLLMDPSSTLIMNYVSYEAEAVNWINLLQSDLFWPGGAEDVDDCPRTVVRGRSVGRFLSVWSLGRPEFIHSPRGPLNYWGNFRT